MDTANIKVQNIKCGGCGTRITSKLTELEGISNVILDIESQQVSIDYLDQKSIDNAINLLANMGYPLADDQNLLSDKAKSYVSCMIGRVQNLKENLN